MQRIAAIVLGILFLLGSLWWFSSGQELANLRGHRGVIRSLSFTPDGQRLISGSDDGLLSIWDATSLRRVHRLESGSKKIQGLAVTDRLLASCGEEPRVILWDLESGLEKQQLEGPKKSLEAVDLSNQGNWLAAAGGDEIVYLWSLPDGKLVKSLTGHKKRLLTVAFSRDGKLLASAGEDGTIRLFELPSGTPSPPISVGIHRVHQLAFAPDGKSLYAAVVGSGIRSWELPSRKEQARWEGTGQARSLAFNSDGTRMATAHEDGSVKLWSVAEHQLLHRFTGHDGPVLAVALNPTGDRLASAGADLTVKIWSGK